MSDITFKTFSQKGQAAGMSPKRVLAAWMDYQKSGVLPAVISGSTDVKSGLDFSSILGGAFDPARNAKPLHTSLNTDFIRGDTTQAAPGISYDPARTRRIIMGEQAPTPANPGQDKAAASAAINARLGRPTVIGGQAVPSIGGLMGQGVDQAAGIFKGLFGGGNTMASDKAEGRNRALNRPPRADDYGAGNLLSALSDSNIGPASFQYNDFTDQANAVAAKNFAPQYQALQMAANNAQTQYNKADPIIEGLYQKLSGDIRNQAQATQDQATAQAAARGTQGQDLQSNIANTYASTQNNQADLLAKLGLQDAAPTTLQAGTNDSAWQQGQAATNTASAKDYINATGTNAANFENQTATATDTQGAVARQNLLGQLSSALSQVDQQRLGVASDQSQAASTLGLTLSDRNYGQQKDLYNAATAQQQTAIDRLMQEYQLRSGIANTAYERQAAANTAAYGQAKDAAQIGIAQQNADAATTNADASSSRAAAAIAAAQQSPSGNMGKAIAIMSATDASGNPMYPDGIPALNIAQSVAADQAYGGDNVAQTQNDFIAKVVAKGRTANPPVSDTALIEAASQMAAMLNYGTAPVQ